jgi:hypothetical protein
MIMKWQSTITKKKKKKKKLMTKKSCHLSQIDQKTVICHKSRKKAIVCYKSTKELSFASNQLMTKVH